MPRGSWWRPTHGNSLRDRQRHGAGQGFQGAEGQQSRPANPLSVEVPAASIFEVHHNSPLASAATRRRTTLAHLAVVCANCHRAIHATSQVEENMRAINDALK
jgi:hypothetical protein